MTTNALVRTAWEDNVFANINAGQTAFDADIWPETRRRRTEVGVYNGRVDFWLYQVRHHVEFLMGQSEIKKFEVEIVRTVENDSSGEAYNEVIDGLNVTLYNLVKTNLGDDWDGTVTLWTPPTEPPRPIRTQFTETNVFEGRVLYTAEKIVDY